LYLGAFFLFAGAVFYFVAHRVHDAIDGTLGPFLVLGLPFIGLNLAGRSLYRRDHQAVAVAFYLGGLSLLPLFLLIWFHETGIMVAPEGDATQLFPDGVVSNRQLQITSLAATAWAAWLAFRTRTSALSIVSAVLVLLSTLSVLSDFGLRTWLEEERFDLLALHLAPVVGVYGLAGWWLERKGHRWFAGPLFVAGAVSVVAVLDLWALNGKLLHYAGLTLSNLQPADVDDPTLLDALAGLSLNGVLFYAIAAVIDKRGSTAMTTAAQLLFTIAPFSMLEPLAWLSKTGVYNQRFDWLYLGLAVAIAIVSYRRQRKSFYYAGIINTAVALILIADRHDWFDKPAWAVTLVGAGLGALAAGLWLEARRRQTRSR
jgi:hypothetical protein